MTLNPNAKALPQDIDELRTLAKAAQSFRKEAVARTDDQAQWNEQEQRRRNERLDLFANLKQRLAPVSNLWRDAKIRGDKNQRLEAEVAAAPILAELRALCGCYNKSKDEQFLAGDVDFDDGISWLNAKGKPVFVRLQNRNALTTQLALIPYGLCELKDVDHTEGPVPFDLAEQFNQRFHGARFRPAVVSLVQLEVARAGAEELRHRIQSAIDKSAAVSVDPVLLPSSPRQKALSICSSEREWRIGEEIEAAIQHGGDVVQRLGDILHKEYVDIEKALPDRRNNLEEFNAFQEAASQLDYLFKLAFFSRHDGAGDLEKLTDKALESVYQAASAKSQRILFGMDQPPGRSNKLTEEDQNHAAKLDHVILWILVKASRPLIHKEIETEITASWGWYCEPVRQKTIANHFSGNSFLQSNTMKSPSRGRIPSKAGLEWVQRNPCPTPP